MFAVEVYAAVRHFVMIERNSSAMILDPYGRIVVESTAIDDNLVMVELDLDLLPLSTGRRWIRGRRLEP